MARISSAQLAEFTGGKAPKHNKFGVSPSADRTWRGRTYASKAEMFYAQSLELNRKTGDIVDYVEQPPFRLGEDTTYRPDFLVIISHLGRSHAVDVKGAETREFKKIKKLWEKYARIPLHVVKWVRKGGGSFETIEVVEGRG